jgi:hypothetical protein
VRVIALQQVVIHAAVQQEPIHGGTLARPPTLNLRGAWSGLLEVVDAGIGLPEDAVDQVFQAGVLAGDLPQVAVVGGQLAVAGGCGLG